LGGIDLLALGPFEQVGRTIVRIGTPPFEHAAVDCLVDVDVGSVVATVGFSTDGSVEGRRDEVVQFVVEDFITLLARAYRTE
jgi:hypothetical protein